MKDILKTLCSLDSVAGYEDEIRQTIERIAGQYADEVIIDGIGNLLVFKKGCRPRSCALLVDAQMDEPGWLVGGYTASGLLKLVSSGNVDTRSLTGQRVKVGPGKIAGTINHRAVALTSADERKSFPDLKDLYVDIGCQSYECAKALVTIGEPISLDVPFSEFGDGFIRLKAASSRIGCAVALKLLSRTLAYDTWFAFTTGGTIGETGARGAITAGNRLQPDIALILGSATANDIPGVQEHKRGSIPGNGAVVPILDVETVYQRDLRTHVLSSADQSGIRWQYSLESSPGNDGSALHISGHGAAAFALLAPTRYAHGAVNVVKYGDIESMLDLAALFIEEAGGI